MWTSDPRKITTLASAGIDPVYTRPIGLFHVTRALAAIKCSGLKSTSETGMVGFGQGDEGHDPNTISVTWSYEMAVHYWNAMTILAKIMNGSCGVRESIDFLLGWFGVDSSALLEDSVDPTLVIENLSVFEYQLDSGEVDLDRLVNDLGQLSNQKHFEAFFDINRHLQERRSNISVIDLSSPKLGIGILGKFEDYEMMQPKDVAIIQVEVVSSSAPEVHEPECELKLIPSEVRILKILNTNP